MKIIIAGGSGLIGTALIRALVGANHRVVLLTRNPERTKVDNETSVSIVEWNPSSSGDWSRHFDGSDVIINLAGESIGAKRWTLKHKQQIISSRIDSTRAIITAIEKAQRRPSVLLNASAVGYYGNVPEGEVTELNPKGRGFLSDVCERWETEALKAQELGVRVVLLRTGIVLDKKGGALQKLLLPFKLFVGGPLGSGVQWLPWIHLQDEVHAILYAIENAQISGPVNLSAPLPVRMREFCHALGKLLHRPSRMSMPAIILKLILGEMAKPLILDGQQMIPKKLLDSGFEFQFPDLESALKDILYQ